MEYSCLKFRFTDYRNIFLSINDEINVFVHLTFIFHPINSLRYVYDYDSYCQLIVYISMQIL